MRRMPSIARALRPAAPTGKRALIYNGMQWDSQTELFFYHWVEEGMAAAILRLVGRQTTHTLAPGVKWSKPCHTNGKLTFQSRSLCSEKTYTDDFTLEMARFPVDPSVALGWVPESAEYGDTLYRIDTKAAKGKTDSNWNRRFSDNQRWLWASCRVYVNRVDPFDVFRATWVPMRVRIAAQGKTGLMEKIRGATTIETFLQQMRS